MYYVFDDGKNKFESMTREQIMAAIAEATGTTPSDVDEGYITTIKEQNANQGIALWVGTQAQYNAIQNPDENTLYCITDPQETNAMQNEIDIMQAQIDAINAQTTGAAGVEIVSATGTGVYDSSINGYSYTFTNIPTNKTVLECVCAIGAGYSVTSDAFTWIDNGSNVTAQYFGETAPTFKLVYSVPSTILLTELTDIRVGGDGTTYASAGSAVRTQFYKASQLVINYVTATQAFDSTYSAIETAVNAGKNVVCKIACGNSYFFADLNRWRYNVDATDEHDEGRFFAFDYQTETEQNEMWWGRLKVYESNQVYYDEGSYTAS